MPLVPDIPAHASGTPGGNGTAATKQRTPNRAQINKLLEEFAAQNPQHVITPAGLAKALRKLAAKQQQQEASTSEVSNDNNPVAHLNPGPPRSAAKRFAVCDQDDLDGHMVASPSKKIRLNGDGITHVPLGEYKATTPSQRINGAASHKDDAGSAVNLPQSRGFTPINEPRTSGSEAGLISQRTYLPTSAHGIESPAQLLAGPPMRRHGGHPSGSPSSPMRLQQRHPLPAFSSSVGTGQRKTAPARLNLELPGAAPPNNVNQATHYVALPAYKRSPAVDIDKLEQQMAQTQIETLGAERVTLLKTPIYNLEPEDMKRGRAAFVVKPIPQTPASALASALDTKFTLATPATARFSTAARQRSMAAATRAQSKIAEQIGTPKATGQPTAYQVDRRTRRVDRILGALNHGNGGSSRSKEDSRSASKDHSAKSTGKSGKGKTPFDLISALSLTPELAVAVTMFLPPRDLLTLYSVSVQFHVQINTYLQSSIVSWAREWAPDASRVYLWGQYGMYKHFAIEDPAGRPLTTPPPPRTAEQLGGESNSPWTRQISRKVPSMKWYQMIALRDEVVTDILAHLARNGFRCPKGTKVSLLKMWIIMDLPTNSQRMALMDDGETFSDHDLTNIAIFLTKLNFRVNDPIYGPESSELVELMLGQKSLYSLWQMLFGHKYRDCLSLVQCKIRYDLGMNWVVGASPYDQFISPIYARSHAPGILGVPPHEIGRTHFEHWGEKGVMYAALRRPSECVMAEAARRDLRLAEHLVGFVIWGHVDLATGRNLAPSEEEIWMRDYEHKTRAIDVSAEFTPFHCRKARWSELDERGRKRILLAQQVQQERVYRWDNYKHDDPNLDSDENLELNADIRRARIESAGVDVDDPSFRVNADGDELPAHAPPAAAFLPGGAITAGLWKASEFVGDDGYESDSSADSLEAVMDINDDSKLRYAWTAEGEDHAMHVPQKAPPVAPQTRGVGLGNMYDAESGEEAVDGDLPLLDSDEETEHEDIWEMWGEMEPKVFKILFDLDSDDDDA